MGNDQTKDNEVDTCTMRLAAVESAGELAAMVDNEHKDTNMICHCPFVEVVVVAVVVVVVAAVVVVD